MYLRLYITMLATVADAWTNIWCHITALRESYKMNTFSVCL